MISESRLNAPGMIRVCDLKDVKKEGSKLESLSESDWKSEENIVDYCAKAYYFGERTGCCNTKQGDSSRFLWNEHVISASIEKGNYIPAVQDLWTSGNLNKKMERIKALITEQGDLHAPLMYELSLLLYQKASKESKALTLQWICWPFDWSCGF